MKRILILLAFLQLSIINAQSYEDTILEFQKDLNEEYKNPDESPLEKKDLKRFDRENNAHKMEVSQAKLNEIMAEASATLGFHVPSI